MGLLRHGPWSQGPRLTTEPERDWHSHKRKGQGCRETCPTRMLSKWETRGHIGGGTRWPVRVQAREHPVGNSVGLTKHECLNTASRLRRSASSASSSCALIRTKYDEYVGTHYEYKDAIRTRTRETREVLVLGGPPPTPPSALFKGPGPGPGCGGNKMLCDSAVQVAAAISMDPPSCAPDPFVIHPFHEANKAMARSLPPGFKTISDGR